MYCTYLSADQNMKSLSQKETASYFLGYVVKK
jgi:hypothetical protein